jgi:ribosomal-protein-alanine N-acetyltransferase
MNVNLRFMEEDDLDQILEVSSLSLKESWSKSSFFNELSNSLAKYMIAEINNKIVGFAGVWIIVDEGHITNIAVHPDFRGQGIGEKLVLSLLNQANNWAINAFTLEVRDSNIIAQNLYKKLSFIEEGRRKNYYSDNNEDAIIMWRRSLGCEIQV